ncbi:MAG: DUF4437 domain-containing protein [Woeseiaceae bacterium]|nr:DUF4437 domain-containing protein [Woeseiaceae bacterium]
MRRLTIALCVTACLAAGCATGPQPPPYPAFVQADALPDQFMATLPGIRARQFSGNAETGTSGSRIDLPPDWRGTTGGMPGRSLELFVLAGTLSLADIELGPGGYAYVPPGSIGFNLATDRGARVLWFVDEVDPAAVIRTPIVLDSELVDWVPAGAAGTWERELRSDPGSGARTRLLRVEPGAVLPFEASTEREEGFLVSGEFRQVECVAGEPYVDTYTPGGYFNRPPGAVHGGQAAAALKESVWLLREARAGRRAAAAGCPPPD